MRHLLNSTILLAAYCATPAQDHWMGMYLQGKKVGYSSFSPKSSSSEPARSLTFLDGKMLGFGVSIKIASRVWTDGDNKPTKMEFEMDSGGVSQKVTATFTSSEIQAISVSDGRTTKKTLPIPEDAVITDDALTLFMHGQSPKEIYLFDPNTLALVKCQPKKLASEEIETSLGKTTATVFDIQDPRAPMKIYLSSKGDVIKATGPFGLEMRPVDRDTALATGDKVDIALASSIKPDREIPDSLNIKTLTLKVTGIEPGRLKSDDHQTVTAGGNASILEIHPVQPGSISATSAPAPSGPWLLPDIHIPSDKEPFVKLAKSARGDSEDVLKRAESIRQFVHGKLRADAGVGILRDAEDILKASSGVCRDHAILMATLLRADKIPTKVVSGLVYGMGAFYYHAWVEIWTGANWLPLDSTRPSPGVDATHIKIGEGTVGDAFTSFILDGASISVLKP